MNKRILLALGLITCSAIPAGAVSLSKTYSYFSVGGNTLDQIENELAKHGPQVKTSNKRHPGATQMEFTTRLGYAQGTTAFASSFCQLAEAKVTLKVKIILPRWSRPRKAEQDVRLIWDTLASDIKRHEEGHVVIAKNYAREMERAMKAIDRQKDCKTVLAKAKEIRARILEKHDKAQEQFDRVESVNFERRIMRLLGYRLERMEAARRAG
ncbi:DUF922 domain-containing protein [Mesorhizobium sp. CGMCC 1.15528]|uniref:DUF922 domain-containing protein n=1 Tax=Mesorhizobium zhangyense TaxID=1776730 RepID=A0A7C9R6G9_9HYPH|nr:DUF922 domain-containing protein [Mesorhizobium zhangyense]NGN39593.1 DUF922 domain-containing protein [Mesorhizobium zhangyense]